MIRLSYTSDSIGPGLRIDERSHTGVSAGAARDEKDIRDVELDSWSASYFLTKDLSCDPKPTGNNAHMRSVDHALARWSKLEDVMRPYITWLEQILFSPRTTAFKALPAPLKT